MWWNRPLSEKTVSERSTLGASPTYTWSTINPVDWWTKFRLKVGAWAAHLHYKNSHAFVPSVFMVKVQFFSGMILRTEKKGSACTLLRECLKTRINLITPPEFWLHPQHSVAHQSPVGGFIKGRKQTWFQQHLWSRSIRLQKTLYLRQVQ